MDWRACSRFFVRVMMQWVLAECWGSIGDPLYSLGLVIGRPARVVVVCKFVGVSFSLVLGGLGQSFLEHLGAWPLFFFFFFLFFF